jgi:hypothetical protein
MNAYDVEGWHDFAVAGAGAAAALTGLLFVAISINLQHILAYKHLPGRAAATLSLLVLLLFASMFVLAPGQSDAALGVELGLCGAALAWIAGRTVQSRRTSKDDPNQHPVMSLVLMLVPAGALIVSGVTIGVQAGGGLYWVLAAVVTGFVAASTNAWVLLVEIER